MAATPVIVDCAHVGEPDMGVVERLARLGLGARRRGRELLLRGASDGLLDLVRFAGLDGVLRVEVKRQPEEREEPGGVQEERDLGDLPA
jgi:STAS domain-containing protein